MPPPLPRAAAKDASPGAEPLAPTLRLSGQRVAATRAAAGGSPARGGAGSGGGPAAEGIGSATLPASRRRRRAAARPPPRPHRRASRGPRPDADEAGPGAAPFSSSTLAELYLRQGLQERAAEVYRQVLADDPRNERARAGLAALEREGGARAPKPTAPGGQRALLERQIAGLEAMLASVRRR